MIRKMFFVNRHRRLLLAAAWTAKPRRKSVKEKMLKRGHFRILSMEWYIKTKRGIL